MPNYSTVPTETVAALVSRHPATRLELNSIRDRRNPDRFQSVYRHAHGPHRAGGVVRPRHTVTSYRARVFKFFELGSGFTTAEDAARAVVAFYKAHYGERWARAFEFRKVTPWRVRLARRGGRVVGWTAFIFVRGKEIGVTRADAFGRAPGASEQWVWPSPEAAKDAARRAMKRRFDRESRELTIPAPGLLFWRG
jgi:hypothetical protein